MLSAHFTSLKIAIVFGDGFSLITAFERERIFCYKGKTKPNQNKKTFSNVTTLLQYSFFVIEFKIIMYNSLCHC